MAEPKRVAIPTITAIAGTNGAGKSSILGEYLRHRGGEYFNPDEVARRLRERHPGLDQAAANGLAWTAGRDRLIDAIEQGHDYVFETTLGGNTIPRLLASAAARGHRVVIWYVGLDSPEARSHPAGRRTRATRWPSHSGSEDPRALHPQPRKPRHAAPGAG